MRTVTASNARANWFRLINEPGSAPVLIVGKRSKAVLMSEVEWRAIQETLYLLSIPKTRQSIRAGLKTPVSQCQKRLRW